jgi:hypothetical protein
LVREVHPRALEPLVFLDAVDLDRIKGLFAVSATQVDVLILDNAYRHINFRDRHLRPFPHLTAVLSCPQLDAPSGVCVIIRSHSAK